MKIICSALLLFFASSLFAQRLPQTAIPSHYKLALDPRINDKTFSGEERIDVQIKAATKEIVLNSVGLEISQVEVLSQQNHKAEILYDAPDEMVRLQLPEALSPGTAQIHLKFGGKLTGSGLRGLYLSKSSRREYAVTQFEGTYARMMFPCFDEPAFKATFDLTVTADNGDTAISNGHIVHDEPISGNRHRITFSTSPKMSTYLVALAIGDWQCLSRTVDAVPVRVCAIPEKKEYGAFALEVATHSIEFYNKWYGIKYPFGKLDMVAIPDYEWGGMENTASIFYRDTSLLLDEKNASVFRRRGQATTIAHEIAHQWFGDLVTAAWWDDIWLNEGFATWMSRKPIAQWHPEWHLEEDAAADAQQIIGVDSLASARAVHGNPNTPSEIKEMFDGITYEKGGAVLRMLESYLGAETFRKGVNTYLAAHANGNASSTDFWQAEAEESGKPIDKIMQTFVLQTGVPMLSFSGTCSGGAEKLTFSQRRFFISAERLRAENSELWQIPVCTKSTAPNSGCVLIKEKDQSESAGKCSEWTFANRDADGYYRVAYSPEDLKLLSKVAEQQLSVPERIAFVEDTWAMTRAARTSVVDFLAMAQQLHTEPNRHVIDFLSAHLAYVGDSLIPDAEDKDKYKAFIRAQFAFPVEQIGWNSRASDTDEQKALRATLLEVLGTAGQQEAVAESRKLADQYMQDASSVDGTLVGSAFPVVAENGDAQLYDRFTAALSKAKSADEYYHYLYALAEFRQPELLERTIALVEQGKLRQQDYPRFFGALLANPASRDAAWKYLKEHWNDLSQKVTSFGGAGAVSALGNACSAEMRDDVKQFFSSHSAPGAQRAVNQSLERIENCVAFQKQHQQALHEWLAKYSQ